MDVKIPQHYLIQIRFFDFQKGSILEEIIISISDDVIFSLKEAILSKKILSFGNSLITNEINFTLSEENVNIKVSLKIKDKKKENYESNISIVNGCTHIVPMKYLNTEIQLKLNSKISVTTNEKIDIKQNNITTNISKKISFDESNIKNTLENSENYKEFEDLLCKNNEDNILLNIESLSKRVAKLESIIKIQSDNLLKFEKMFDKHLDSSDLERIRIENIEKKVNQIRMIISPLTLKYMFEFLISLAHKKFRFGYKEVVSHSNKLNDILESIYYYIEGPNLISEDVDINFLNNIPFKAKEILISQKGNLRQFLKSIQDLYDYLDNTYFFNDIRKDKLFYDSDIHFLVNFLNILIGNIVNID